MNHSICERQRVNSWPLCVLHNVRIVDCLPSKCPLATPRPHETIARMQDVAWAEMNRVGGDHEEAGRLLNRFEICNACEARNHSVVRRLRREFD